MRDIVVTMVVFGAVPFVLMRPWIGVLMWCWLGFMNPHRLTWGFAFDFPFAQVIAIVTLLGMLMNREPKRLPLTGMTMIWLMFILWINFTTLTALTPQEAYPHWDKAMKIQLFALVTILLINKRERINWLVGVITLSLGFFGFKGGMFSVRRGGEFIVWGPAGSFIADNNALALALIMVLPLMYFLFTLATRRWQRWGLVLTMIMTGLSILTSHSRGALLAGSAMVLMLWKNSKNRGRLSLLLLAAVPVMFAMMPDNWYERMSTISTWEEDTSAQGRVTAWQFAAELAAKRPIGGGFGAFIETNYQKYSPEISERILQRDGRFQGAHSIYFRVLGEHGFPGLLLFLALGIAALRTAGWIVRNARKYPDVGWAGDLAAMIQVGLIGYAVGGAFLGLSYFDLYYELLAVLVVLRVQVEDAIALERNTAAAPHGTGHPPHRRHRRHPARPVKISGNIKDVQ